MTDLFEFAAQKQPPAKRKALRQQTQDEAWAAWQGPASDTLDAKIMMALKGEPHGLTCEEIEQRVGSKHQSVSGNLRHLVERGFAIAYGSKRPLTSGRLGIVWHCVFNPKPQQK